MSEELHVGTQKTREEMFDALQEFVTEIDGIISDLNNHDLDMDGFSQEVNQRIEEFLDANFK